MCGRGCDGPEGIQNDLETENGRDYTIRCDRTRHQQKLLVRKIPSYEHESSYVKMEALEDEEGHFFLLTTTHNT